MQVEYVDEPAQSESYATKTIHYELIQWLGRTNPFSRMVENNALGNGYDYLPLLKLIQNTSVSNDVQIWLEIGKKILTDCIKWFDEKRMKYQAEAWLCDTKLKENIKSHLEKIKSRLEACDITWKTLAQSTFQTPQELNNVILLYQYVSFTNSRDVLILRQFSKFLEGLISMAENKPLSYGEFTMIPPTEKDTLMHSNESFFSSDGYDGHDRKTYAAKWSTINNAFILPNWQGDCFSVLENNAHRFGVQPEDAPLIFSPINQVVRDTFGRIYDELSETHSSITTKIADYDTFYDSKVFEMAESLVQYSDTAVRNGLFEMIRFLTYIEDSFNDLHGATHPLDVNVRPFESRNQTIKHIREAQTLLKLDGTSEFGECIANLEKYRSFVRQDHREKRDASLSTARNNGLHAPHYTTHLISFDIESINMVRSSNNFDPHPMDYDKNAKEAYLGAIMRNTHLLAAFRGSYVTIRWCKMYEGASVLGNRESIQNTIKSRLLFSIAFNMAYMIYPLPYPNIVDGMVDLRKSVQDKLYKILCENCSFLEGVWDDLTKIYNLGGIILPVSFVIHGVESKDCQIYNIPSELYGKKWGLGDSLRVGTTTYPKMNVNSTEFICKEYCVIHLVNRLLDNTLSYSSDEQLEKFKGIFCQTSLDVSNDINNPLSKCLGLHSSFDLSVTVKNIAPNIPLCSTYDVYLHLLKSNAVVADLNISSVLSSSISQGIRNRYALLSASPWFRNKMLYRYCGYQLQRVIESNNKKELFERYAKLDIDDSVDGFGNTLGGRSDNVYRSKMYCKSFITQNFRISIPFGNTVEKSVVEDKKGKKGKKGKITYELVTNYTVSFDKVRDETDRLKNPRNSFIPYYDTSTSMDNERKLKQLIYKYIHIELGGILNGEDEKDDDLNIATLNMYDCRSLFERLFLNSTGLDAPYYSSDKIYDGSNIWVKLKDLITFSFCAYEKNEDEVFIYEGSLTASETSRKYDNYAANGNGICIATARDQESKLQYAAIKRCIVTNFGKNNALVPKDEIEQLPNQTPMDVEDVTPTETPTTIEKTLELLESIIHRPTSYGVCGDFLFGNHILWFTNYNLVENMVVQDVSASDPSVGAVELEKRLREKQLREKLKPHIRMLKSDTIPEEFPILAVLRNTHIFLNRCYAKLKVFGLVTTKAKTAYAVNGPHEYESAHEPRVVRPGASKIYNSNLRQPNTSGIFSDDVAMFYQTVDNNAISDAFKSPYYYRIDMSNYDRANADIYKYDKWHDTIYTKAPRTTKKGKKPANKSEETAVKVEENVTTAFEKIPKGINLQKTGDLISSILDALKRGRLNHFESFNMYDHYSEIVMECVTSIHVLTKKQHTEISKCLEVKTLPSVTPEWLSECKKIYEEALYRLCVLAGIPEAANIDNTDIKVDPLVSILQHKVRHLNALCANNSVDILVKNYGNKITILKTILTTVTNINRNLEAKITQTKLKSERAEQKTNVGETIDIKDDFTKEIVKQLLFRYSDPCETLIAHPFDWFGLCKVVNTGDRPLFYKGESVKSYNYFGCFVESLIDPKLELAIFYDMLLGALEKPNVLGRYLVHSGVDRNPMVMKSSWNTIKYSQSNDRVNECFKSDIVLCEKFFSTMDLTEDHKTILSTFHSNHRQSASYATIDGSLLPLTSDVMDVVLSSIVDNPGNKEFQSLPIRPGTLNKNFRYDDIHPPVTMTIEKNVNMGANVVNVKYSSFYHDPSHIVPQISSPSLHSSIHFDADLAGPFLNGLDSSETKIVKGLKMFFATLCDTETGSMMSAIADSKKIYQLKESMANGRVTSRTTILKIAEMSKDHTMDYDIVFYDNGGKFNAHVNVQPLQINNDPSDTSDSKDTIIKNIACIPVLNQKTGTFEIAYDYGSLVPTTSYTRLDILQYALATVRLSIIDLDEKIRESNIGAFGTTQDTQKAQDAKKKLVNLRDFYLRKALDYRRLYVEHVVCLKPYHPRETHTNAANPHTIVIPYIGSEETSAWSNFSFNYPESRMRRFADRQKTVGPKNPIIITGVLKFFKSELAIPSNVAQQAIDTENTKLGRFAEMLELKANERNESLNQSTIKFKQRANLNTLPISRQRIRELETGKMDDFKTDVDPKHLVELLQFVHDITKRRDTNEHTSLNMMGLEDLVKKQDPEPGNRTTIMNVTIEAMQTNLKHNDITLAKAMLAKNPQVKISSSSNWIHFLYQRVATILANQTDVADLSVIANEIDNVFKELANKMPVAWLFRSNTQSAHTWLDPHVYHFYQKYRLQKRATNYKERQSDQIVKGVHNSNLELYTMFEKSTLSLNPWYTILKCSKYYNIRANTSEGTAESLEFLSKEQLRKLYAGSDQYEGVLFGATKLRSDTEFAICGKITTSNNDQNLHDPMSSLNDHKLEDFEIVGIDRNTLVFYPSVSNIMPGLESIRKASTNNAAALSTTDKQPNIEQISKYRTTICRASIINIDTFVNANKPNDRSIFKMVDFVKLPNRSYNSGKCPRSLLTLLHTLQHVSKHGNQKKTEYYAQVYRKADRIKGELESFLRDFTDRSCHPLFWIPYSARKSNSKQHVYGVVPLSAWMLAFLGDKPTNENVLGALDILIKVLNTDITVTGDPIDILRIKASVASSLTLLQEMKKTIPTNNDVFVETLSKELQYQHVCSGVQYNNPPQEDIRYVRATLELVRSDSNLPLVQLCAQGMALDKQLYYVLKDEKDEKDGKDADTKKRLPLSHLREELLDAGTRSSEGQARGVRFSYASIVRHLLMMFKQKKTKRYAKSDRMQIASVVAQKAIVESDHSINIWNAIRGKSDSDDKRKPQPIQTPRNKFEITDSNGAGLSVATFPYDNRNTSVIYENRFNLNITDEYVEELLSAVTSVRKWWSIYDDKKPAVAKSLKETLAEILPMLVVCRYLLMVQDGEKSTANPIYSSRTSFGTSIIQRVSNDRLPNERVYLLPQNLTLDNGKTTQTNLFARLSNTLPHFMHFGKYHPLADVGNTWFNVYEFVDNWKKGSSNSAYNDYDSANTIASRGKFSESGEKYTQTESYSMKALEYREKRQASSSGTTTTTTTASNTIKFDMVDMWTLLKDIFYENNNDVPDTVEDAEKKIELSLTTNMSNLLSVVKKMAKNIGGIYPETSQKSDKLPKYARTIAREMYTKTNAIVVMGDDHTYMVPTSRPSTQSSKASTDADHSHVNIILKSRLINDANVSDIYSFLIQFEEQCRIFDECVGRKYWIDDTGIANVNNTELSIFRWGNADQSNPTAFIDKVMECFGVKMYIGNGKDYVRYPPVENSGTVATQRVAHNICVHSLESPANLKNYQNAQQTTPPNILVKIVNMTEFSKNCKLLIEDTLQRYVEELKNNQITPTISFSDMLILKSEIALQSKNKDLNPVTLTQLCVDIAENANKPFNVYDAESIVAGYSVDIGKLKVSDTTATTNTNPSPAPMVFTPDNSYYDAADILMEPEPEPDYF